jgi:hypothetical protein
MMPLRLFNRKENVAALVVAFSMVWQDFSPLELQ